MTSENELAQWRHRLATLAEETPPPSTWLDLQLAYANQVRPMNARRARWPWALAAALMLALVPVWWMQSRVAAPAGLQAIHVDAVPPAQLLRALDRELQLRYQDGASDEDLAPLWREREKLLRRTQPAAAMRAAETIRI